MASVFCKFISISTLYFSKNSTKFKKINIIKNKIITNKTIENYKY